MPKIAELSIQRKWVRNGAAGPQHLLDERDQLLAHPLLRLRIHSMLLPKKTGPIIPCSGRIREYDVKVLHIFRETEPSVTK